MELSSSISDPVTFSKSVEIEGISVVTCSTFRPPEPQIARGSWYDSTNIKARATFGNENIRAAGFVVGNAAVVMVM